MHKGIVGDMIGNDLADKVFVEHGLCHLARLKRRHLGE
jgi:hypothetical protein